MLSVKSLTFIGSPSGVIFGLYVTEKLMDIQSNRLGREVKREWELVVDQNRAAILTLHFFNISFCVV